MADLSDVAVLSEELMAELLGSFAAGQQWTDLTHHHQVASEIVRQYLTV